MARRQNKQPNEIHTGKFLLFIAGVLVLFSIVRAIVEGFLALETVTKGFVVTFIFLVIGAGAFFLRAKQRRAQAKAHDRAMTNAAVYQKTLKNIKLIVEEHLNTLIAQKNLRTSHDAYGNAIIDGWNDELDYFIESTVKRRIPEAQDYRADIIQIVEQKIAIKAVMAKGKFQGYISDNGHEFERECLEAFKAYGWTGYRTKGSGDQGADLVISKNGRTVAVQCKLYANKVGNSAIQQIYAAKTIYQADFAAVISKSGYTPSALQAAKHTEVFLLTAGAEEELDRMIAKALA